MRARPLWSGPLAGVLAACLVLSCQDAPVCRFGREYALFESETQSFHDVRTVAVGGKTFALLSDARGVHAQPLDAHGASSGAAVRLFEPCDGGFDAVGGERDWALACLRRDAGVTLYRLVAPLTVRATQAFGTAGRLSRGIALVRAGDRLAIAWLDAAMSGSRVWYYEPGRLASPRELSDDTWEAGAPSLAYDGRVHVVWAETRYAGERAESRVSIARPGAAEAPPRVVLESRDPAPSPRLVSFPEGLMLSFRDKRETGRKTGLYLARISSEGAVVGRIVRAGRADGRASPVLEPCLGGVVSATPRTFAGDYFVGVLRADTELRRLSAEQQFYEDSREFDQVAVHCGRDNALLLIAERGRLLRGNAALRSTTFRCD